MEGEGQQPGGSQEPLTPRVVPVWATRGRVTPPHPSPHPTRGHEASPLTSRRKRRAACLGLGGTEGCGQEGGG